MNGLAQLAITAAGYLADGGNSPSDVDPTTGKGPEWGEAAPIGLLVIVLLCVAVYFLVKSMNRNIKKVPASFATDDGPSDGHGHGHGHGDGDGDEGADGDVTTSGSSPATS